MYLKYGLYVVPVILITALAAWLFLKLSGKSDRSNNRILLFGTISSLAVALLIPAIAGTLLEKLSLSIFLSVTSAFLICSLIISLGFIITNTLVRKSVKSDERIPSFLENLINEPAASIEATLPISEKPRETGENQQKIVDTERNTDKIGVEENSSNDYRFKQLLESALDYQIAGRFTEALASYRETLKLVFDKGLATQIIIEICGISKRIKDTQIIYEILNSEQGKLLDFEIKTEILNNI